MQEICFESGIGWGVSSLSGREGVSVAKHVTFFLILDPESRDTCGKLTIVFIRLEFQVLHPGSGISIITVIVGLKTASYFENQRFYALSSPKSRGSRCISRLHNLF